MARFLVASLLASALPLTATDAVGASTPAARELNARLIATNSLAPAQADGRWVGLPSSPDAPGAARDDTTGEVVSYPSADQCPPRAGYEDRLFPEGGVALVSCVGFEAVLDLNRRQLVPLSIPPPYGTIGHLGRQWVLVTREGPEFYEYLNWHTGERRPSPLTNDGVETLDPDTPDLRPLRRLAEGSTLLGRPDRRIVSFGSTRVRALRLRLGKKTVTLARHCGPAGCRSVQYVAGVVTWAQGPSVHAYVVRTGRQLQWTPTPRETRLLAYMAGIGRVPTVTHTARRVYAYWKRTRATLPPNVPRGFVSFQAQLPRG